MKNGGWMGVVILVILFLVLYDGAKNAGKSSFSLFGPLPNSNANSRESDLEKQIRETQAKIDELKKANGVEISQSNKSPYWGLVKISSVSRSSNAAYEYITLRTDSGLKNNIKITNWKIKSQNSGESVTIPKGVYLYFTNSQNSEEDIYVGSKDVVYVSTGASPINFSTRINKCSGYLNQFQTFTPYISNYCPRAQDEDLSSIPKLRINDECLDYIDRFPSCKTETQTLPSNWSYECKDFIQKKLTYSSCIDIHKNDIDFNKHEWRIYLKRNSSLWTATKRESIVLYDDNGKAVSVYSY